MQQQQTLELRATQQLTLSPQIVQAIRILQLSAADLEHEVEEALANNPFLERTEPAVPVTPPATVATAPTEEEVAEPAPLTAASADGEDDREEHDPWTSTSAKRSDDERPIGEGYAPSTTLRDHLVEQLAGSRLSEIDRLVVEVVIDGLDDDGYLRQSAEELLSAIPQLQITPQEVDVAVKFVQSLDPPGIGARSLAECLALQLERHAEGGGDLDIAKQIVRNHLDLLALHDSTRLSHKLGCGEDAIRRANILIRSLNPRPGAQFSDSQARYVVADVIARKVNGKWIASIHPQALPNIQINQIYADALQRDRSGNGALVRHLQEARWLIRNVQQRFETIQRVAQVIVDRQRRFLELGELAMRPMMLRDVARELGLHPSTISRVTSNKYMETPSGLIELKRFFSSRLTNDEDGTTCSSTAIRALIRELIAAENPSDPLSDVQIARILASRSIKVARRTVAKYRTALRIPSVEARRMSVAGGGEASRPAPPRPIAALASERRGSKRGAAPTPAQKPVSPGEIATA
ncbi:MAG: RNA polymerase factor sigma-54 [Burkholderiales bacterium]|nr:RNA polymerase factor sigma-54 [Burkholderiales bacterium]